MQQESTPTPAKDEFSFDHIEGTPVVSAVEASTFQRLFGHVDNSAFYKEALDKYPSDGDIDPAVEKRLVRKIDWTILPLLSVCYCW